MIYTEFKKSIDDGQKEINTINGVMTIIDEIIEPLL